MKTNAGHIITLDMRLWIPSSLGNNSEITCLANGAQSVPLPVFLQADRLMPSLVTFKLHTSFVNSSGQIMFGQVGVEYLTSGSFNATVMFSKFSDGSGPENVTTPNIISVAGSDVTAQYFFSAVATSASFLLVALSILALSPSRPANNGENPDSDRTPEVNSSPKSKMISGIKLGTIPEKNLTDQKNEQKRDDASDKAPRVKITKKEPEPSYIM